MHRVNPLCSRNARPQKGLVGRAQCGLNPAPQIEYFPV